VVTARNADPRIVHHAIPAPPREERIVNRSDGKTALLAASLIFCLTASTACMPLFPAPPAPSPFLERSELRDLLRCQDRITGAGEKLVRTQTQSVEACAMDILTLRLAWENELISDDDYDDGLDKIRDRCDKGFSRVEKASTRFMDDVIEVCDEVGDFILDDYDSLRFQLLNEETSDSFLDVSSIPALAGSLCGIKSLFVNMLVAAQIPRALELFSYLGPSYVVIVGENDYEYGYINIPLDGRCRVPET
jgi:hypothetical protein